jgi:hypothetical protein
VGVDSSDDRAQSFKTLEQQRISKASLLRTANTQHDVCDCTFCRGNYSADCKIKKLSDLTRVTFYLPYKPFTRDGSPNVEATTSRDMYGS